MKKLDRTKNCEALILAGRGGESCHLCKIEKRCAKIGMYTGLFWNGQPDQCAIKISQDTEHKFDILLNERKARAIVKYQDQEFALDNQDSLQGCLAQGILVLLWIEEHSDNSIHLLWIDSRDKTCKNISLESFDYDKDEIWTVFQKIFVTMAESVPQIMKEEISNINNDDKPNAISG